MLHECSFKKFQKILHFIYTLKKSRKKEKMKNNASLDSGVVNPFVVRIKL